MKIFQRRLLLVDDDENLLESAKDILEDAGYFVLTATRLSDAKAHLDVVPPVDIVIVDFNLPDGKGSELATLAKAGRPHRKVIMMTGEMQAAISADAGLIDAVLTKPVDPPTLLTLLTTL